jgi:nitrous oxidase accessory protein NosD
VVLTENLPEEFELGDAVAEIRDYPELHIHDCKMRGNRARGFLLNCRGKTLIENNIFNVPGTALLFEGDARFWFEQAGVRDCVIRNNLFDNCNYGVWGRATIEVAAGIEEKYRAKSRYNRNILIEGNTFRCFDHYPVLKAYSVNGLVFRNNTIEYTHEYPSQNLNFDTFEITDCDNVLIEK